MAERIYSTRRRISIMPRLAAYNEELEEEEDDEELGHDPDNDLHHATHDLDSELLKRLQQLHKAEHGDCDGDDEVSEREMKKKEKDREYSKPPSNGSGSDHKKSSKIPGIANVHVTNRIPTTGKPSEILSNFEKDMNQKPLPSPTGEGKTFGGVDFRKLDSISTNTSGLLASRTLSAIPVDIRGIKAKAKDSEDLTRGETFDKGDDVFESDATPTNHPVNSSHGTSPKQREENLAKKRALTKQPTMPEVAETNESVTKTPNGDAIEPLATASTNGGSPLAATVSTQSNSAFPSLPDDALRKLKLFMKKGDPLNPLNLGDQLSDQEVEDKFASLSLAFKTDKLTLEKRIDLHERARDIAEQNVNKEIDGLKEAMKALSSFCVNAESRDIYSKVQHHVEVLEQSTSRVSSRAEVHGAVQQELRMSKAIEVMVNHVENLKRLYDKEHQELEETKKLLSDNKVIGHNGDGDLSKRTYSAGAGIKAGGRRRASVAVFPRKTSYQQHPVGALNPLIDLPMDPKTRFQALVADTALKTSVVDQLRRSISDENPAARPCSLFDLKQPQGTSKPISEHGASDANTSLDNNSNIDQEAIFQKGYEEGVRAKVGSELSDLRQQQRTFYNSLETLIDQNEVSDEEEQKLANSWVELVWQFWPGWKGSSQKLRFAIAGFVFMLAFLSLIMTLLPVGHASERRHIPVTWASIDDFLHAHAQIRHFPGAKGVRPGPPI